MTRDAESRDAALAAMRPEIATEPAETDAERFLHATLRPALKLQNEALLALTAHHVRSLVPRFAGFAPDDRRERLVAMLKKDSRLKRTLVGAVLGALTQGELAFSLRHEAETRRRIVALLAERLASQADAVAERLAAG